MSDDDDEVRKRLERAFEATDPHAHFERMAERRGRRLEREHICKFLEASARAAKEVAPGFLSVEVADAKASALEQVARMLREGRDHEFDSLLR